MKRHEEPVGIGRILGYSLPATPLIFMTFLANLYLLKFTTDVLLIAPAAFGTAFAAARLWDAVSDPLAGYWSDRTISCLGRRRPWLLGACVPMGFAFAAVWSPPALEGFALELWMGAAILSYYTAQSAAYVPHLALGAELSLDYQERSRLATGRGAFELVGMLLAAGAIGYLSSAEAPRLAATRLAMVFGLVAVALIVTHVSFTRERDSFQGRGAVSLAAAGRDVLSNPHARLLLFVFFIEMLSLGFLAVLFPFLADHVGAGINPGVAMGAVMAVASLSVPGWLWLSRKFDKRTPWMIGIAAKGTGFGLLYFLGSDISVVSLFPMALIGAGQACTSILPTSIKADVIDYDELETGERKEGAYFAAWNLALKLASALSIGLGAFLLEWAGYQPHAEAQTPSTIEVLKVQTAALPFVLHLLAFVLLFQFRLGPKEYARIRRELDASASGQTGA